jgi:hypothetical protein
MLQPVGSFMVRGARLKISPVMTERVQGEGRNGVVNGGERALISMCPGICMVRSADLSYHCVIDFRDDVLEEVAVDDHNVEHVA